MSFLPQWPATKAVMKDIGLEPTDKLFRTMGKFEDFVKEYV